MEEHPVWKHFAANHGVMSREEALGLGVSKHQLGRRVRSGQWVEIAPKVYRHPGAPVTWLGRARAAALSVDSIVSHRAAARIWGLDGFTQDTIEVVVREGGHRRRSQTIVHRSKNMDLSGSTIRSGVPVTGAARTMLDVAGVVSLDRLHKAVDSALRKELLTWNMLFAVLIRHSARGRNGCGTLRALLEDRFGDDAIPDSDWNRDVADLLTDGGLPQPVFEHEVRHDGRFVARVDLAYPDLRLAIECDSARWHKNSVSFVRDPRRRNKLLNAGWRVLSFTWQDYADTPRDLVASVRAAIGVSQRAIARIAQDPQRGTG